MNYDEFFAKATGLAGPHPYQRRLAQEPWPDLVDVPTGLGKTAAVIVAWVYRRRVLHDPETPRRLVYCLPMRVLVEQTMASARRFLANVGLQGGGSVAEPVGVHVLMGGATTEPGVHDWAERPDADAILVGTQDMLLSRALMRGYGASRYRWPVEFALLHADCLWVFDEIQLMGSGLPTSAQLEALRCELSPARRCRSIWMSATLRPDWLRTVDLAARVDSFTTLCLDADDAQSTQVQRRLHAAKRVARCDLPVPVAGREGTAAYARGLAERVLAEHRGPDVSLVIVNTVERAQAVYAALAAAIEPGPPNATGPPELLLVHSRFRGADRRAWEAALAKAPGASGRIVVATQAVEAGVDLTSRTLYTELAPWSALVQRFGRCNRYGECNASGGARVFWIDLGDAAENARPYEAAALTASRARLENLVDAGPARLPAVDQQAPEAAVLRRKDLLDLFDTDPDLSGFDLDVSPYVRDADAADVLLFWRDFRGDPMDPPQPPPARDELCRAGPGRVHELLKRLEQGQCAAWDALAGRWQLPSPAEMRPRPGTILMIDTAAGGYRPELGLAPGSRAAVPQVSVAVDTDEPETYDDDSLSLLDRAVPLSMHLGDVAAEAAALCGVLDAEAPEVLVAARWHDVGKAHPAFQSMLRRAHEAGTGTALGGGPWAKAGTAPGGRRVRASYEVVQGDPSSARPRFRHELASALAWLDTRPTAEARDADSASLVAYLIAAHHGKVRLGIRALPDEREPPDGRPHARGVWERDELPAVALGDGSATDPVTLRLAVMRLGDGPQGPSWTARTRRLLVLHGPFRLAWYEALVRIADWRASRKEQLALAAAPDSEDANAHGSPRSHSSLATPDAEGAPSAHPDDAPGARGAQHGVRRRAGAGRLGGGTSPPDREGTRNFDTALGVLSHADLAPRLAGRVFEVERAIADGRYDGRPLDEALLLDLHGAIAAELVPSIGGRWRCVDVRVGLHDPPPWPRVPERVRDYIRDLAARVESLAVDDTHLMETLAFAEGALLSVHPFADFNGRLTRVFLALLLKRLDLPSVDVTPAVGADTERYLAALRAADVRDWQPLELIWSERLARGEDA